MGWASGESLFYEMLDIVRSHTNLKRSEWVNLVSDLVDLFENYDADTLFDDPGDWAVDVIAEERGYYDEDGVYEENPREEEEFHVDHDEF